MKSNITQFFLFLGDQPNPKKDNSSFYLTEERIGLIGQRLEVLMEREKPFLRSRYCMKDLSNDLQIPSYQLSAYINRYKGLNFNDYINQFRVAYSADLIRRGTANKLNLKGLAGNCGFNNRNSFTTAFKKFTGSTPFDYTKSATQYDSCQVL